MGWTRAAQKSKKGSDTVRTVIVRDAMRIPLGKQGENDAVRIVWPEIAAKYAKLYGEGRFELVVVQRGQAYLAVVNVEGADLVWDVHVADVATAEVGSLELIYYAGDTIAKSQTWDTVVVASKSAEGTTEPPEPQKSWVDNVIQTGAKVQEAQIRAEGAAEQSAKKAQEAAQSAAEAKESAKIAKQEADRALTLIDDTAIVRDKTWSSRNIVDMVCPAINETGNPVVCTPVPNYPLGVKTKWAPIQEGSGEPSPDNIRPIKGRDSVTVERTEDSMTRTLTLPSTIYGGEVDAVTGEGKETWHIISVTGKEPCHIYDKFFYIDLYKISGYNPIPPSGFTEGKSSHYEYLLYGKIGVGIGGDNMVYKPTEYPVTVEGLNAWMNYCAEQYVAGTPVQVAYEMAKPIPFTATGNAQIPALDGTNTILTDADTVSVTGRETPQSYIDRKLKETNTAIAAL